MTCPQEVGTSVNLWTMGPLLCDVSLLASLEIPVSLEALGCFPWPTGGCCSRSIHEMTNSSDFILIAERKYTIHWQKIKFQGETLPALPVQTPVGPF